MTLQWKIYSDGLPVKAEVGKGIALIEILYSLCSSNTKSQDHLF